MNRHIVLPAVIALLPLLAQAETRRIALDISRAANGKTQVSIYSDVKSERRKGASVTDAAKVLSKAEGWGSSVDVTILAADEVPPKAYTPIMQAIAKNPWLELGLHQQGRSGENIVGGMRPVRARQPERTDPRPADRNIVDEATSFIRGVIVSLLEGGQEIPFEVPDQLFAIDNGERVTRDQFKEYWPTVAKMALKKRMSMQDFFASVDLKVYPANENKRMLSNDRVMQAYTYQAGDMYCDASKMKLDVENPIGYDKAFIYVIRKVNGNWTLIGVGG